MSKQISANELAKIVTRLLAGDGEIDGYDQFQDFMTDIAQVVCDYCGGEVRHSASMLDGESGPEWFVGVHGNDSLPSDGGVWRGYDIEGSLEN